MASEKRKKAGAERPRLSREELLAIEDELIIEYQKEEFQRKLHELWGQAGGDYEKQIQARQTACLPFQLPIVERYGFERSRAGVAASVYAYQAYPLRDPENLDFLERSTILTWLVNPPHQLSSPKPRVPLPLWWAMRTGGAAQENSGAAEPDAGGNAAPIALTARRLSGAEAASVRLLPRDRVLALREAVERETLGSGACTRPFKLVHGGRVLGDAQTLESVGLADGDEISVVNLPPFQALTASGDRTARLFDAGTGEQLQEFRGHTAAVRAAAFSPDGHRVVTASKDRTARVWSAATGGCLAGLEGHGNAVNRAAFSPSGLFVATASDDYFLKIWDPDTGACEKSFYSGGHTVNSVTWSPDGRLLLLALADNTARLMNPHNEDIVQTFQGHGSFLHSACLSSDGSRVATAGDDGTARLFDAATGACCHVFTEHRRAVNDAQFSADGRQLLTASDDGQVLLFDTAVAACRRSFRHARSVNSAAFSPDGRHVLTACDDRRARLFHTASGDLAAELQGHQGAVYRGVFAAA